jgi:hypothetical protein
VGNLPYYTLEQASSVLNNKFKTDIYNSESILVLALNYQIDLHILFHGDWTLDFDCYIPINSTNPEKSWLILRWLTILKFSYKELHYLIACF